jgi:hypothetical protein
MIIGDISFSDTVMNIYTKTMTEDDDKEVVAQACMSVSDVVKECGFTAIEPCKLQLSSIRWPQHTKLCVKTTFLCFCSRHIKAC